MQVLLSHQSTAQWNACVYPLHLQMQGTMQVHVAGRDTQPANQDDSTAGHVILPCL